MVYLLIVNCKKLMKWFINFRGKEELKLNIYKSKISIKITKPFCRMNKINKNKILITFGKMSLMKMILSNLNCSKNY